MVAASLTDSSGRGKGRPSDDVWTLFTDSEHPQRLHACMCRHCGELITHYKKSERVKSHLARKCEPFRALMLRLVSEQERPDWFNDMHVRAKPARKKRTVTTAAASDSETESESESEFAPDVKKPKTDTVSSTKKQHQKEVVKQMKAAKKHQQELYQQQQANLQLQEELQEHLAMHFYVTDTPLTSAEDSFLLRAFRVGHPNVELPTSKLLKGKLLEKCYKKIKALVDRENKIKNHAKEADALDGSIKASGNAVVRACVQFIHDLFASKKQQNKSSTSRHEFEDLAVFVANCSAVVSFFTAQDAQMKSKLETEQLAQGIEPLVAFNPQSSPWHWRNLKPYLDRIKSSEDLLYDLVTASEFLGGDNASGLKLKQKAAEQRKRIVGILLGGRFFEQLSKSIQILTPIHAAMLSTTTLVAAQNKVGSESVVSVAQVPISTGYHSLCRTLKKEFAKLSCLTSDERAHVSALLRETLAEQLSRSEFGMAYLLDPRFLGTGMTDDERDHAEDQLFDFFQRTGGDVSSAEVGHKKEQLFQEYTDFVVKGNSAKQQGTPQYQLLKKGSKSIQQYWLTDGKQFPLLQQVALAVFERENGDNSSSCSSSSSNNSTSGSDSSALASTPRAPASTVPLLRARKDEGLSKVQLRKIAFIKTHAALLLPPESDPDPRTTTTTHNTVKEIIV